MEKHADSCPALTLTSVLDPDVQKGQVYQYGARRVFHVAVDGQILELDGQF
jgi:hypothetical protein